MLNFGKKYISNVGINRPLPLEITIIRFVYKGVPI
jgi:hypothetical protein